MKRIVSVNIDHLINKINEMEAEKAKQQLEIVMRGESYEDMIRQLKQWVDEEVYLLDLPSGIAASNNAKKPYRLTSSIVND